MTYPFTFADVAEPTLELGEPRRWGGLQARFVRASAGRHIGQAFDDHRLIFYTCGPTQTACGCEGYDHRRLQVPGEFDVVPSGALGYWEDSAPIDMVSVRMSREMVGQIAEDLGVPGGRVDLAPQLGVRDPLIEHLLRTIGAELDAPAPAARIHADSLAVALVSRLLHSVSPTPARGGQMLSKPQLRRLIEYVDANLEFDLTLAELAAVAGVSVPHLTTLFRRTFGQSVHRYVVERRVQRARERLLAGECSIAQVALETGFAHQSHLARWMRRLLGITPSVLLRDA